MIPFWCPSAETFLTDWFTSGKPRRLLYRHTEKKKKTQRDLIVRLDVVGRCAYINYFTRCLERPEKQNKKQKTKNQKPNNFTPIVFLQFFCFFHFFWPPLFRLCRRLLLQLSQSNSNNNKKSIMERTGVYFFSLRLLGNIGEEEEEERYTNMKNDLECVDIPPFPTWWNGPFRWQ